MRWTTLFSCSSASFMTQSWLHFTVVPHGVSFSTQLLVFNERLPWIEEYLQWKPIFIGTFEDVLRWKTTLDWKIATRILTISYRFTRTLLMEVPGTPIGAPFFEFEQPPTGKDSADPTQHEYEYCLFIFLVNFTWWYAVSPFIIISESITTTFLSIIDSTITNIKGRYSLQHLSIYLPWFRPLVSGASLYDFVCSFVSLVRWVCVQKILGHL